MPYKITQHFYTLQVFKQATSMRTQAATDLQRRRLWIALSYTLIVTSKLKYEILPWLKWAKLKHALDFSSLRSLAHSARSLALSLFVFIHNWQQQQQQWQKQHFWRQKHVKWLVACKSNRISSKFQPVSLSPFSWIRTGAAHISNLNIILKAIELAGEINFWNTEIATHKLQQRPITKSVVVLVFKYSI